MQSEKFAGRGICSVRARYNRVCLSTILALLVTLLLTLATPALHAQDSKQAKKKARQESRLLAKRRLLSRQRRIQQTIQDTYSHRYEIYTGGMYMRFRPGPDLHNAGTGGWALGLAGFLTPRFGITGDARGYYGSTAITVNNPYDIHNASFSSFTFTAGPQYRFYRGLRFALSAAVQGGINYAHSWIGRHLGASRSHHRRPSHGPDACSRSLAQSSPASARADGQQPKPCTD